MIAPDPELAAAAAVPSAGSALQRTALFVWAVLRLPLLLAVLYLGRHGILKAIEARFDIVFLLERAIDILSTPVTRALYALVLALVLLTCLALTRRLLPRLALVLTLGCAAAIVLSSLYATGAQRRFAAVPVAILATNLLYSAPVVRAGWPARLHDGFMLLGVGLAEIFTLRGYLDWLIHRLRGGAPARRLASSRVWLDAPAVLLAGLAAAMLIHRYPLVPVERALRMPAVAMVLAHGDFNWTEFDQTGRYLYATGPGLPRLLRYRTDDWSAPPFASPVETDGAQAFAYDPGRREIHTFSLKTKNFLSLDADTLVLKRSIPIPNLSPGDPWIVADEQTDTIAVVSEADEQTGVPFVLLDRSTGAIVHTQDLDPGNVLKHPRTPLLYMSFFRRQTRVLAYDLARRDVVLQAPADPRTERMEFWPSANELLVTSPTESRILRYDADTLAPRGAIRCMFGVRAIAVDDARGLLLCGSLAAGLVAVVDLRQERELARYYLGPWLRTITLDPREPVAYVTSRGALYRLRYWEGTRS
jgi:hypothetical protein